MNANKVILLLAAVLLITCGAPPPTAAEFPAPATEAQTPLSLSLDNEVVATFLPLVSKHQASTLSLSLVKKVVITADAEGGSARPEVAATADRVFALYLGNIAAGNDRTFSLKIYDANLEAIIASKVLVSTTAEYGGPTDIRVTSDGQFLYAFYETHKSTAPGNATTYLWGAKYSLDDNFDRVAYTATPIANSGPLTAIQDGEELLDDPAPLLGPDSVFVVTRLKYPLATSGQTIYHVREFNKNDLTQVAEFDLDLSEAADGRARVTSLLYWNESILIALATTVSDTGINETSDDGARSDIILIRMRPDWTFDPQNDVHTLAAEPDDRENYVCGLETDGNYFYLTYKQSIGQPPSGEHIAWIRVFDQEFNAVYAERVRSVVWGPGGGEMRPSLEVMGDRLLSGQSAGQGLGQGNAEIWVYQIDANR